MGACMHGEKYEHHAAARMRACICTGSYAIGQHMHVLAPSLVVSETQNGDQ